MKVVVVGIGSAFRSDDAAGLEVARLVADAVAFEGDPVGLIDLWAGADLAIVVDAVRSHEPDGTITRVELDDATSLEAVTSDSSHALGLIDAVLLAQTLDRMPGRLVLYGITASRFDAGDGMTPAVAQAIARCAQRIVDEMKEVRAACA